MFVGEDRLSTRFGFGVGGFVGLFGDVGKDLLGGVGIWGDV